MNQLVATRPHARGISRVMQLFSLPPVNGNFRGRNRQVTDRLSRQELTAAIAAALNADTRHLRAPAKTIANAADCSVRTAENLLQGLHPPGSLHLMRLAREFPTVGAEVRRLTDMEHDIDPETANAFNLVFAWLQRRRG